MTDAARLMITLLDLEPAPWRRLEVPLSTSLEGLHRAIQAAFLWHDSHLWEFELDGRRYGPFPEPASGLDDERVHKAGGARLAKLLGPEVGTGADAFLYTYDMGDCWEHEIEVEALFAAEPGARLPRLLDGAWRAPPEDCGGVPGFEAFLEALADPKHPEHAELLEWHGGPFDPADIDEEVARAQLRRLARARRG